mmetsp:Transcript_69752/g.151765  ORF Transcript_69752/g.151765 Transcript_69752/m.151765 type:complete len:333 (+) Transcript_69752:834-1832(+)
MNIRIDAHGMNRHFPRIHGPDAGEDAVMLRPVYQCAGEHIDFIAVLVGHRKLYRMKESATSTRRQAVYEVLSGLQRHFCGRSHFLCPGSWFPGQRSKPDQLKRRFARNVGEESPLERPLDEGQVPPKSAGAIYDDDRMRAVHPRDERPLRFDHGAFYLIKRLVRVRQHHVDVVGLRHSFCQQSLQTTHRCAEEVHVLSGPLYLPLTPALKDRDVALGDVVVHGHCRVRIGAEDSLRPHEDSDEGTRGLIKLGAHELPDGWNVLGFSDQILLEVCQYELPELRRQILHKPIVVVGAGLEGLARVIHPYHLQCPALGLEALGRPRDRLEALEAR